MRGSRTRLGVPVAAAIMLLTGFSGQAATRITGPDGKLTGAQGVLVAGQSYDVAFDYATCTNLTGGCASRAFAFQDFQSARGAVEAIVDQVIGTTPYALSTLLPCGSERPCGFYVPVEVTTSFDFFSGRTQTVVNSAAALEVGPGYASVQDFSLQRNVNTPTLFARFTPIASAGAVPEPSTRMTLVLGFGVIGGAARSRRSPLAPLRDR